MRPTAGSPGSMSGHSADALRNTRRTTRLRAGRAESGPRASAIAMSALAQYPLLSPLLVSSLPASTRNDDFLVRDVPGASYVLRHYRRNPSSQRVESLCTGWSTAFAKASSPCAPRGRAAGFGTAFLRSTYRRAVLSQHAGEQLGHGPGLMPADEPHQDGFGRSRHAKPGKCREPALQRRRPGDFADPAARTARAHRTGSDPVRGSAAPTRSWRYQANTAFREQR
jgi:hypothetical protein